jgi:hypothetical protein
MELIKCQFSLYFFLICLSKFLFVKEINKLLNLVYKTRGMYSIQCCTSNDNTCSSKPVDCPSNICFKLGKNIYFKRMFLNFFSFLVINKETEERGCLDDLIRLLNFANKGSRTSNEEERLSSGSSNDQCQKLGTSGNGMSLCKCTSNLCNLSSKTIHLTKPVLTLFILLIQCFLRVFLS